MTHAMQLVAHEFQQFERIDADDQSGKPIRRGCDTHVIKRDVI